MNCRAQGSDIELNDFRFLKWIGSGGKCFSSRDPVNIQRGSPLIDV